VIAWLLAMVGVLALVASCGDKDPQEECPSLQGDSCTENGLLEIADSALCDACGQVWNCARDWDGSWYVEDVGFPCSCINDEGFLDVGDTASTGCTWEL
jgi:hypothetical protein